MNQPRISNRAPGLPYPGIATASFVVGLIGMIACPFLGVVAIVLGGFVLYRLRGIAAADRGIRGFALSGVICGGIATFVTGPALVSMVFDAATKMKNESKVIRCRANLNSISLALLEYQVVAGDGFPTIEDLRRSKLIREEESWCPASTLTAGSYPLTAFDPSMGQDEVVIDEPQSHHAGIGRHRMFADGRIEFLVETIEASRAP